MVRCRRATMLLASAGGNPVPGKRAPGRSGRGHRAGGDPPLQQDRAGLPGPWRWASGRLHLPGDDDEDRFATPATFEVAGARRRERARIRSEKGHRWGRHDKPRAA